MQPEGGLSVQEREVLGIQAAHRALQAVVASFRSSDDPDSEESHLVKEAFRELSVLNRDQSVTTAIFRAWGLAVPRLRCHHARVLLGLIMHHLESLKLKPGTLVKPLKSLLRYFSGAPDLKNHSSLIGETLAELVRLEILSQSIVLGIIKGALVDRAGDMERGRCFACLAAFYMRLSFFHEASSIPMDDSCDVRQSCRRLLPKLLPEEMQAQASADDGFLSDRLHEKGLHPLLQALKLPIWPLDRPRDPQGYFSGLLDHGEKPDYTPAPEYDPADLDRANCLPLSTVEWPALEHACSHQQSWSGDNQQRFDGSWSPPVDSFLSWECAASPFHSRWPSHMRSFPARNLSRGASTKRQP
ncbi:hypothetical protein WJX84_004970 [Apatococcus fuscideae]|uniref:Uncharacterized protein n=1 Tax=Apatococcus fuscideae TaxID=2026836 RepID=A0AAW1S922_9CHLO